MAQQRRLGKVATSVRHEGEKTIVRYHDTDVVAFDNKTIWLNSGGWYTQTTCTRMNQASNQFGPCYSVRRASGKWIANNGISQIIFEEKTEIRR